MRAVVRAKGSILANRMLHHAATAVHLRVKHLATGPLFLREGRLIDVHNLIPRSHDVFLRHLLAQSVRGIARHTLCPDL